MKYKIFDNDKIVMLGQDSVGILTNWIIKGGVLEEFCGLLLEIDTKDAISAKIKFNKEFKMDTGADYILFHLVMLTTTLLKIYADEYIMEKKLFGGYRTDLHKKVTFDSGLEKGLKDFRERGRFKTMTQIKADTNGHKIRYFKGDYLSQTFPYFNFGRGLDPIQASEIFDSTFNQFAKNISYIREPEDPDIPIYIFSEKAMKLTKLAEKLLYEMFVE